MLTLINRNLDKNLTFLPQKPRLTHLHLEKLKLLTNFYCKTKFLTNFALIKPKLGQKIDFFNLKTLIDIF